MNISISFCEELDKVYRDFLWGDDHGVKMIHLVGLDMVCRLKELGGLRLRQVLKHFNLAALSKLAWLDTHGFMIALYIFIHLWMFL